MKKVLMILMSLVFRVYAGGRHFICPRYRRDDVEYHHNQTHETQEAQETQEHMKRKKMKNMTSATPATPSEEPAASQRRSIV